MYYGIITYETNVWHNKNFQRRTVILLGFFTYMWKYEHQLKVEYAGSKIDTTNPIKPMKTKWL